MNYLYLRSVRCSSHVRHWRSLAVPLVIVIGILTMISGCSLLPFNRRSKDEIKTDIAKELVQFACCRVLLKDLEDGVAKLIGRVESHEQKQTIIQTVKDIKGIKEVEANFETVPKSFVEVSSLLREFQKTPESGIAIQPSKGCDETYYRKEQILLNIKSASPLRHLYVDYYTADEAKVIHLIPGRALKNNIINLSSTLQADGGSFNEPFGMELITVISSSMQLIYPARPKPQEEASRYMQELRKALFSRDPKVTVFAHTCLITTQAAPQSTPTVKAEKKETTAKAAALR